MPLGHFGHSISEEFCRNRIDAEGSKQNDEETGAPSLGREAIGVGTFFFRGKNIKEEMSEINKIIKGWRDFLFSFSLP